MNYQYIANLDGWGKLSVENLKNSIEKSKKISLQRFIYSIGIRHIGIENAKILSENLKTVSNFLKVVETKQFEKLLNFDGIGETQINSLKKFFSNKINIKIVKELNSKLKIEEQKAPNHLKLFISAICFCNSKESKSILLKPIPAATRINVVIIITSIIILITSTKHT